MHCRHAVTVVWFVTTDSIYGLVNAVCVCVCVCVCEHVLSLCCISFRPLQTYCSDNNGNAPPHTQLQWVLVYLGFWCSGDDVFALACVTALLAIGSG